MHVDETTLYLSKPELVAMAGYISRDEARPELGAMFVDHEHGRVWATDGHRAAIVTAKGGDHVSRGTPFAVAAATVDQLVRAAKARDTIAIRRVKRRVQITVSAVAGDPPPCRLSISVGSAKVRPAPIEAVIPRYESKAGRPAQWVALNPRYIGAFAELWKLGRDDSRPVVLYRGGELDPVLGVFETRDGSQWRVIIMPINHRAPARKSA